MPAAAVIRRVQALSGFTGFKGCVGGQVSQWVEISGLNPETAVDTICLEYSGGERNMSCSGEMLRYDIEHPLRRQLATLLLIHLRHESVGIKQD